MNSTCPIGDAADLCTLQTCSLECAEVKFLPTLAGNTTYAVILGLLLVAQLGLRFRYRTVGFTIGMFCGLVLEVIGYSGRVMLHSNPFSFDNFLIYLIPLTIGPAFLTGSIYLCLGRIIVAFGSQISRLRPRTYAIFFMSSDFFSLVLQAAGGAIAAVANDSKTSNMGRNIMIAGLAFQVVSLAVFLGLWVDFLVRLRKVGEDGRDERFESIRSTRKFKCFNYALWIATVLILIRSIYRVVELQEGFSGPVASNEAAFMVFEGPMIILAVFGLTIFHPGRAFAGKWQTAAWSLRRKEADMELKNNSGRLTAKRTNTWS
ncbi:RTA1-domain-containing protein [Tothia fuscella]|uniref:RTA1-domain-containing protein n=1 Tax=Tothia fuscella TaxID=1048955 RepID=A0A9P4NI54_9PEZI|nr:RTA1-domain-containing protein [Tothia fuscella]